MTSCNDMHTRKPLIVLRPATGAVMVPLRSLEPSKATTDSVVVVVTRLGIPAARDL